MIHKLVYVYMRTCIMLFLDIFLHLLTGLVYLGNAGIKFKRGMLYRFFMSDSAYIMFLCTCTMYQKFWIPTFVVLYKYAICCIFPIKLVMYAYMYT